ncbi:MAG TPA: GerMN domain-containing protein, partial [Armatimonadota bacterium]|nr:GerMN domain-containing protein [Armatimonadota bacterium]
MAKYFRSFIVLCLALMLISALAYAQTPADVVAEAVATSEVFPAGTSVVNVFVDGSSAVVELSAEAVPFGLGDGQVDDMCKAIMDALDSVGIDALEVTVAGKPLWQYLPAASAPDEGGDIGTQSVGAPPSPGVDAQIGISSIGGGGGEGSGLPVLTGELVGKNVGLCPS